MRFPAESGRCRLIIRAGYISARWAVHPGVSVQQGDAAATPISATATSFRIPAPHRYFVEWSNERDPLGGGEQPPP